jgi:hypothetical protein
MKDLHKKPFTCNTLRQGLLKGKIGTNERGVFHLAKPPQLSCADCHNARQPPGS